MKKHVFIAILCMSLIFISEAQTPESVSDKKVAEALEKLTESQYVRIPKKDFDAIIENQITVLVNKKINTLIALVVAAIGLFSGLSLFQNMKSKSSLKEEMLSRISGIKNELGAELQGFIEKITEANIEPRFKNYEKFVELEVRNVKSESQTLLVQIQEEFKRVVEERKRTKEYIIDSEFQLVQNAVNTKTYSKDDLVIGERLLKDLETTNPENPKIPALVDLLSYVYYDNRSYKELTQLIEKYKDSNLSSNTYINAALTAIYDYHNYATPDKKIKALDYLDRSLEITQAYGEALGLKLEIFMMDYTRNEKKEVKKEAVTNAEAVIESILNSASDIPSYETINRLSRDITIESYQNLIDSLYNLFKTEMEQMLDRANRYDLQRGRSGFTLAAITTKGKDT
ncbi:MAG: hypothetical protein R2776_04220 [Flavobacteriaceae bacterium]|nr:hypothetical protein [Flavobacteriaceae bacterium]